MITTPKDASLLHSSNPELHLTHLLGPSPAALQGVCKQETGSETGGLEPGHVRQDTSGSVCIRSSSLDFSFVVLKLINLF